MTGIKFVLFSYNHIIKIHVMLKMSSSGKTIIPVTLHVFNVVLL